MTWHTVFASVDGSTTGTKQPLDAPLDGACRPCPLASTSLAGSTLAQDCRCDPDTFLNATGECDACPVGAHSRAGSTHTLDCQCDWVGQGLRTNLSTEYGSTELVHECQACAADMQPDYSLQHMWVNSLQSDGPLVDIVTGHTLEVGQLMSGDVQSDVYDSLLSSMLGSRGNIIISAPLRLELGMNFSTTGSLAMFLELHAHANVIFVIGKLFYGRLTHGNPPRLDIYNTTSIEVVKTNDLSSAVFHFAIVYTYSVPVTATIYVNGVAAYSASVDITGQQDSLILNVAGGSVSLGEVRVYNAILSRAKLKDLSNGHLVSSCVCNLGYYMDNGQGTCTACPLGQYEARDSSGFALVEGCLECPQGTFSDKTAAISNATCLPCDTGTYADASGKSSCTACPGDSTTLGPHSTQLADCVCESPWFETNALRVTGRCIMHCPPGSHVADLRLWWRFDTPGSLFHNSADRAWVLQTGSGSSDIFHSTETTYGKFGRGMQLRLSESVWFPMERDLSEAYDASKPHLTFTFWTKSAEPLMPVINFLGNLIMIESNKITIQDVLLSSSTDYNISSYFDWNFIGIVLRYANDDTNAAVFLNGQKQGEVSMGRISNGPKLLGFYYNALSLRPDAQKSDVYLDDVRVFESSLLDSEINTLFNALAGSPCLECRVGSYKQSSRALDTCTVCPANTTTLREGQTNISDCICVSGYTKPDSGPCTACNVGTYKSQLGNASCTACPTGASTLHTASVADTDCVCNAGFTGPDSGPCTACNVGTYKSQLGNASCTACPTGASTLHTASVADTDCVCNAGFTGPDSGPCTACNVGTYKSQLGSATCVQCGPDATTLYNASTDISACVCNAGYTGPDGGQCQVCTGDTFKAVLGNNSCTACQNGSAIATPAVALRQSAVECECAAGTYGVPGDVQEYRLVRTDGVGGVIVFDDVRFFDATNSEVQIFA